MNILKKTIRVVCIFSVGISTSCNSSKTDNEAEYESLIEKYEQLKSENALLTQKVDTINNQIDSTLNTKKMNVSENVHFLFPGLIGNEEIDVREYDGLNWIGLSYRLNSNLVEASNATITIKSVESYDSSNYYFPAGVKVNCLDCMDSTFLLISGIEKLKLNRIINTEKTSNILLPGHSFNFGDYKIKAYSDSILYNSNWYYEDYKLVITGRKNGKFIQQVFLEIDNFDDNMVEFIWVGDIDGDQIPDLFMDISYKYSFSRFALFLSSVSKENELLKKVNEFDSFGC